MYPKSGQDECMTTHLNINNVFIQMETTYGQLGAGHFAPAALPRAYRPRQKYSSSAISGVKSIKIGRRHVR